MFHSDILQQICEFLQPLELHRLSLVNKQTYQTVVKWMLRMHKTVHLQDFACPACGDWKSTDILLGYEEFFDTPFIEFNERVRYIEDHLFRHKKCSRTALLCSDCEYKEWDAAAWTIPKLLPYRGSRQYELFISPQFALLFRHTTEDRGIEWNEFRMILDGDHMW